MARLLALALLTLALASRAHAASGPGLALPQRLPARLAQQQLAPADELEPADYAQLEQGRAEEAAAAEDVGRPLAELAALDAARAPGWLEAGAEHARLLPLPPPMLPVPFGLSVAAPVMALATAFSHELWQTVAQTRQALLPRQLWGLGGAALAQGGRPDAAAAEPGAAPDGSNGGAASSATGRGGAGTLEISMSIDATMAPQQLAPGGHRGVDMSGLEVAAEIARAVLESALQGGGGDDDGAGAGTGGLVQDMLLQQLEPQDGAQELAAATAAAAAAAAASAAASALSDSNGPWDTLELQLEVTDQPAPARGWQLGTFVACAAVLVAVQLALCLVVGVAYAQEFLLKRSSSSSSSSSSSGDSSSSSGSRRGKQAEGDATGLAEEGRSLYAKLLSYT